MMSLNRYKLKHKAKEGHKGAKKAKTLLKFPEKLIGVILIGNNLVNNAAVTLMTIIVIRLWPENQDLAMSLGTVTLTFIVLIFAEVTPKPIAQRFPEKIAFPAAYILQPLLWLLYPAVWLTNALVSIILSLVGIRAKDDNDDSLTAEELRTIVNESGETLPETRQNMLLGILDLDHVAVNDIMIPRNEVVGIDLDDDIETIKKHLSKTQYTRLPIYKTDLDKVIGILHIRDIIQFITSEKPAKVMLTKKAGAPYFVPETTPLQTQLLNFQREKLRMGLVVDEYGDVQGIVTLEDLLEEIVGDFTTDIEENKDIHKQRDGSYVIDGSATVRDINRHLDWDLPTDSAKTLSGFIVEHLEDIPDSNMSFKIGVYMIEILQVSNHTITVAKIEVLA
jgi:Mg2+/Co2+ transporter CorB